MRFGGHDGEHGPPVARQHVAAMFALVALALMLTACGGSLDVQYIGRAEIREAAANKAVVIGQLHIRTAAGISIIPSRPIWSYENPPQGASVQLVQLTDDSATFNTFRGVSASGRFAWAVKPGTYVINIIFGLSTADPSWDICPKTAFRIDQSTGIVNLGEIVIDLPSTDRIEGQSKSDFCNDSKIKVTQNAGEITSLVRQPLTAVAFAPELPLLWDTSARGIKGSNVPEARAVLRRLGVTISGHSPAAGQ